MEFISKTAVVAEIERRIKEYSKSEKECLDCEDCEYYSGEVDALENFRDEFLDTLETKDVDLDKESMNYLLNEHRSPLNDIMHKVDLKTEMQYHKDIQNAFKAGYNKAMEERV